MLYEEQEELRSIRVCAYSKQLQTFIAKLRTQFGAAMAGSRPGDASAAPPASASDALSKPLVGLRVHGTGLDPDQRELLRQQLRELGATFEGSLDTNNLPDVLVARSVMVDKYQVAAVAARHIFLLHCSFYSRHHQYGMRIHEMADQQVEANTLKICFC